MSVDFAVERIIWLHKRIKDGYYPNAMRLAERFGISQRQAQRDVDYLRTELGAPLEFCRLRKGYRYTEDFELGASIEQGDRDDYVDLFAAAEASDGDGAVQMSIPYTAVLEISDYLSVGHPSVDQPANLLRHAVVSPRHRVCRVELFEASVTLDDFASLILDDDSPL